MGCTPLFLNAEPHSTGTNSPLIVPARSAPFSSAGGDLLVGEVLLHHRVVGVHDRLEQLVAPLRGLRRRTRRGCRTTSNFAPSESSSSGQIFACISTRSITPRNSLSAPIGSCTTAVDRGETVLHHVDAAEEVGADAVHLVDEADARHVVLVGLAPHRLGLRLDAGDGVEHRDRAVEDAQRALDLDREVDVAGRVDDVDLAVAPLARGRGRRDRDAALLLLDHVVHDRRAFVHLTDLVGAAGVVEDALGRRGLARVDVGHDADVAGLFEGELAGHVVSVLTFVTRDVLRTACGRAQGPAEQGADLGVRQACTALGYAVACSCITARILIGLVSSVEEAGEHR